MGLSNKFVFDFKIDGRSIYYLFQKGWLKHMYPLEYIMLREISQMQTDK